MPFPGEQRTAPDVKRRLTPCGRVGVINGGVDVAKIDFAHETINLNKSGNEYEEQKTCEDENPLTFSCREKLANLD
jgi:hypothetical protein